VSNARKAFIVSRIKTIRSGCSSHGSVTCVNRCTTPARSTLAASYCSLGIVDSPASRMITVNGSVFQTCAKAVMRNAPVGEVSQAW
jgi:hypothetical protein